MRILVVTATVMEISPVVSRLTMESPRSPRLCAYQCAGNEVDVLQTGVGMVATAAWCSRTLVELKYDLALNVGLCGSFDAALAPGSVVHVVSDRIVELGAEDGDAFLTIEELKLLDHGAPGAELVNARPPVNAALNGLPLVRGITVNTVHGNERSIEAVTTRFQPQVESMEGAAFMYACLIHDVPFAQVRAVSNVVERRNRGAWRIPDAIDRLSAATIDILRAI